MKYSWLRLAALLLTTVIAGGNAVVQAAEPLDFNRDVRPILSNRCFKCHGPDLETREADLRLDTQAGLFDDRGGYAAFVGGDAESSEALRRVLSDDESEKMPPPDAKKDLTPREVEILKAWVAQGASWEPHWAFVAPTKHVPPAVKDAAWPRNAIDRFILARLEAEGLKPSAEADGATLVRRVYLDLIGLPPTPDEVDAFLADRRTDQGADAPRSPGAYERLVDRLLASPHYGERWARRWLDLARYADTNGYEKDRERTIWPYRDWVVDALNAGMPFDEFTVKQLAGDLLPNATLSDRIATGFHRNTMLNEEGGIDPLEFRYHAMTDRVATTGTTWLGLTTGCAQCHDHKYDPISHREYFGLMAFLDNADEPELPLPDPTLDAAYTRDRDEADRLLAELPSKWPGDDATRTSVIERRFAEWLDRERSRTVRWTPLHPTAARSNLPLLTVEKDHTIFVTGDTTKQDRYELTLPLKEVATSPLSLGRGAGGEGRELTPVVKPQRQGDSKAPASGKAAARQSLTPDPSPQGEGDRSAAKIEERESKIDGPDAPSILSPPSSLLPLQSSPVTAILLEALPDPRLPAGGPGMTYYEGTHGDFFLTEFKLAAGDRLVPIGKATHSYSKNRFGKNPATAAMAVDGDMQTGWSVDGRQGERHTAVFALAEPLAADELRLVMTFGRHFGSSLGKFRVSVTTDPSAEARDLSPELEALLAKPDASLTDDERTQLRNAFLLQAPELAEQAAKITSLRKPPAPLTTLVFTERPPENPRPTFLRNRGEYLQPKDEVDPLSLDALHPFPDDLPRNRLGLAKWLVAPDNPLTARVIVNRQWAALFGRGLVSTVQDFGFQGEPPSHPQLLDWLAVEFIGNGEQGTGNKGWRLKDLHRLIVTSATYRQSSDVTPELLAHDPQNVLMARGPRLRLEAELIRDAAMASSGLLVPELHGPPVHPPQPDGVVEAAYGNATWTADIGSDRYRRSLYTFIKRTAPFAMYTVFDAPSGEACTARRDVSNTALQSLTLLNDAMFLEAAKALGKELAVRDGSDADKASHAFRRILTRPPDGAETQRLVDFVQTQRERFAKGELDPAAFAGPGEGDPAERATWTALARALLSLDEAVTRS